MNLVSNRAHLALGIRAFAVAAVLLMPAGCPNGGGGAKGDGGVDGSPPVDAEPEVDADLSHFDFPVRALRVIDGDTLVVQIDGESVHVRLLGVNCPEVSPQEEPYGPEAEDFTRYHVESLSWIGLEFDDDACAQVDPPSSCFDAYDRLLAYVRTDGGDDLGYILLANGLARVYTQADFQRKPDYLEAEDYAQQLGVGIWSQ